MKEKKRRDAIYRDEEEIDSDTLNRWKLRDIGNKKTLGKG